MKKLSVLAIAFAAIALVSCGNKSNANASEEDTIVKSFEQTQLEEAVKVHFDSIAAQIGEKKFTPLYKLINDGELKLTDEEKKVQPDYLIKPEVANDLQTIAQKYAALYILNTDKAVANLYGMDVSGYDKALAKLAADVNDPVLEKLSSNGFFTDNEHDIYTEMEKNGRIHFFWVATCAGTVEQLYIASQNTEKFLQGYDDETVANITFRIVLILDAIDNLSVYDAEIQGFAETLGPLKKINATTVDELKAELAEVQAELAESRKAFLE